MSSSPRLSTLLTTLKTQDIDWAQATPGLYPQERKTLNHKLGHATPKISDNDSLFADLKLHIDIRG